MAGAGSCVHRERDLKHSPQYLLCPAPGWEQASLACRESMLASRAGTAQAGLSWTCFVTMLLEVFGRRGNASPEDTG